MFVGALELDLLLGDVRSLKQKRSVIRPVLAELRRLEVSATESDGHDLHRRAALGIAVAAPDAARVTDLLDRCERFVAARPEFELLAAHRRLFGPED
ncbi:MAG: DUF503 domain-containing protein [Sciscionella sp.]